ncbi:MAG: peptide chain release factor N(5)-glutamine methyltransferase [Nitrospirae bacterium]|nr:peptide chain release factor N(5)-glutamine methyltransferase [Nitrospirota bacterium]
MKALEKLKDISTALASSGIESPAKEAEIILRSALDMSLVSIYSNNPELTPEQLNRLDQIIIRRANREPLQYILGHVDFMGLKLFVGQGVLIPRPETELMAEIAIKKVRSQKSEVRSEEKSRSTQHALRITILDLCTGSGCLALALAKEFPDAQVYGVDISETALSFARKNAGNNSIGNVTFLQGPLFDPVAEPVTRHPSPVTFDHIISNPPYIKTSDIKDLQPEIKDWEPLSALDGGEDGLNFYRKIISTGRQFLKDNGILMLELGEHQAQAVAQEFEQAGFKGIEIVKDYAGIKRIIHARNSAGT